KAFGEWDDTSVYDMKDNYTAITDCLDTLESSFDTIKAEIDAGRPVLMSMVKVNGGHSVVAYGYDDDITFTVWDTAGFRQITAPGFAVMDTWTEGSGAGSAWYSSELIPGGSPDVQEYFDPDGIEWWPYVEFNAWFLGDNDWQVQGFHTFEPVPEPATIILFGLGGLLLRRKHRK
ncbi:MAG: C39 family peptidase, partial [Planctomycetota bacterium]